MRDLPLAPTPQPRPIQDSTGFYKKEVKKAVKNLADSYVGPSSSTSLASNKLAVANKNLKRQALKGKPGYDAMGFKKP